MKRQINTLTSNASQGISEDNGGGVATSKKKQVSVVGGFRFPKNGDVRVAARKSVCEEENENGTVRRVLCFYLQVWQSG